MGENAIPEVPYIWLNGEIVPWKDATVHVLSTALHYGIGVFEGIRAYSQTGGGGAVFRLDEHMDRLFAGLSTLSLSAPCTQLVLTEAILDLLRRCELEEAYIRPLVFVGKSNMGLQAEGPMQAAVAVWPWGSYHGGESAKNGLNVITSPFMLQYPDQLSRVKGSGKYIRNNLAKRAALMAGADEALMCYMPPRGPAVTPFVAEATGQNYFDIRADNVVRTPSPTLAPILDGLTRQSIMTIIEDEGIEMIHGQIRLPAAYDAKAAFLCGTASEIVPIAKLGDTAMNPDHKIIRILQQRYKAVVHGEDPLSKDWLTPY